jgi:hypothetical protein
MLDSLHPRRPCAAAHLVCSAALALILGSAGCGGDDIVDPNDREGRTVHIPLDVGSLGEAIDTAVPGDTLVLGGLHFEVLTSSLVIPSSVTPLVIRGDKSLASVAAPSNQAPALIFQDPKAGTRVDRVGFAGGNPAVQVTGSGALVVERCAFTSGVIGVLGAGSSNLTVTVRDNLVRDPLVFGFEARSSTRLIAEQNTIVNAGDCGILVGGSSMVTAIGNIITGSVNFGVACQGGSLTAESGCNDIYDSGTAHYSGCTEAETSFSLDPEFCDANNGDFTLHFSSPCAELNSGEECGRLGAFEVGCDEEP